MKHVFHSWILFFSTSITSLAAASSTISKNVHFSNFDDINDKRLSILTAASVTEQHDTVPFNQNYYKADSLFNAAKDGFKLNEDAVKSIRFDFSPTPNHYTKPKTAPIDKPWMEFQVDLSVPKSLIDTTRVRKPENFVRMLPYTIWTRFGEDPIYNLFVFGNKKLFEIMWKLNLEGIENYSRDLLPNAGKYNPNSTGASVVIGNLDFIGFLYNNLNKQGRIRKHNRKYANAWKTYQSIIPTHISNETGKMTGIKQTGHTDNQKNRTSLRQYKTVELIEEKNPTYFSRPDHRLLQTPDQRSRFGTFYDPELYAMPSEFEKRDSIDNDSLNVIKTQSGSDAIKEKQRTKSKKNEQTESE